MPSSAWQTRSEDWLEWIEADANASHAVWVSCDEFDEDLRTMLERFPFLGGLDTTSVSIVAGPLVESPPRGMEGARQPDAGFDSMTTLIRQSPLHDDIDDHAPRGLVLPGDDDDDDRDPDSDESTIDSSIEAAQTMVRGRVADDSAELEIGIAAPEAGLEIGLDAPQGGEDEGLFIPNLTRAQGDAPARTGDTLPPRADGTVVAARHDEYGSGPISTGTVVQASPPRRATDGGTVIASEAPTAADVIAYARQYGYVPPQGGETYAPQPYAPQTPYSQDPVDPSSGYGATYPTPDPAAASAYAYDQTGAPAPPYAQPGARTGTGTAPGTDNVPSPGPGSRSGTAPAVPPPPPAYAQAGTASVEGLVDRTVVESTMDTPPAIDLASARAQAYDDDELDADDVAADRSAASSQTAGEIVTGFDAAEPLADAGLDDVLDEEDSPIPRKIVVVDPAATGHPAPPEEELDTVDILDADTPPPPASSSEPMPTPPSPPEPQPRKEAAAPAALAKGPPQAPPAPKGPPPAPRAARKTDAARNEPPPVVAPLLPIERDPSQMAAFERAPKDAAPQSGGWYDQAFGDHYAALTRQGHPAEAKAEVEFFVQSTGLQPGASVLDVGCGDGAHAIVLAQRGYAATGFDSSMSQMLRATQANEALGAGARFLLGDIRDPPVDGPFDGIICLGTTLGYFEDDDNRKAIRKLRDRLTLGGRLLIQVFNRDHVIARLPARSWWQGHGCLVLDEAHMNYFTSRLQVHRTVVFEDGRQFEHDISVRAYTAHDLGSLCVDAGLRVLEISGSRDTRGRFYGATSPEIWLLVERV